MSWQSEMCIRDRVGTISANSDETVGKLIAEAMDKVGKEGVITCLLYTSGFGANLADNIAIVVADKRVEIGDDTDGVIHIAFAHRFVGGNAVNARCV